jgi:hypothetical protein
MFVATTLLYPLALAVLCIGAGLLADRLGGVGLRPALLAPVGAAALIALSQLSTSFSWSAPATPWLLTALALAGLLAGRGRLGELRAAFAAEPLPLVISMTAYLLALAPVLLSGRPGFSSGALSDPAVHLIGADYLIHHGQSYGGLDLANSYGGVLHGYYAVGYPSGADTMFGGSALLLGLPLIWAYQPFNAFVLALGCGPAWVLARRLGAGRATAAAAALTAVLPALVYGYELEGSVKELTAMSLLLACGCLVSKPSSWLGRGARGAVPLALLFAAGLSVLGPAFGAWAIACTAALVAAILLEEGSAGLRRAVPAVLLGSLVILIAALPTWRHLGGALHVAREIASTSNPGNLTAPLHSAQVLGVWLNGSFKLDPPGTAGWLTDTVCVLVALCALAGAAACLRERARGVGLWIAAMLLTWLVVSLTVTTWAGAKTLVLTSPAVMLLAWAGVGLLRGLAPRALAIAAAGAAGAAILAGVLVSDELQYNAVNLATTARYDELGSIDRAFAGHGPALFTDFDEYALYSLRDLDLGSPNFASPSPALASAAAGYGRPFALASIAPRALAAYPLIVTRRDPQAPRPPAAYTLARAGRYYMVWRRTPAAPLPVSVSQPADANRPLSCSAVAAVANAAGSGGSLAASLAPRVVGVPLAGARRPRFWGGARDHVVMKQAGVLRARFSVPAGGDWDLWLRGRLMPSIGVGVDGRAVGSVSGQVSGNSLITSPAPPLRVRLGAGAHTVEVRRAAATLAPGGRGAAVLTGLFLTPADAFASGRLVRAPAGAWRSLCAAGPLQWVEGFRRAG